MSSLQYAPKTTYRLSDCFAPERDLALLLEGLVTLGIGQDIECFEKYKQQWTWKEVHSRGEVVDWWSPVLLWRRWRKSRRSRDTAPLPWFYSVLSWSSSWSPSWSSPKSISPWLLIAPMRASKQRSVLKHLHLLLAHHTQSTIVSSHLFRSQDQVHLYCYEGQVVGVYLHTCSCAVNDQYTLYMMVFTMSKMGKMLMVIVTIVMMGSI